MQARTGKGLLNENLIPESTGVDEYYAVTDWAIKDGDDLKIIDFETYRFEKDTELYAIVKDSRPLYTDMKADRTDWFYQYVRICPLPAWWMASMPATSVLKANSPGVRRSSS